MSKNTRYPSVKDILSILSKGVFLSSLFVFPGAALGIKAIYDIYDNLNKPEDYEEWDRFNKAQLKFVLKRLRKQKYIQVINKDKYPKIIITKKGRRKILQYKMQEMKLNQSKKWDNKWRVVIYDISKKKKNSQEAFRRMLKQLQILKLQNSVYLTPFPCEDEINYLREYYNIGKEVILLTVDHIEDEEAYKKYFKL